VSKVAAGLEAARRFFAPAASESPLDPVRAMPLAELALALSVVGR
jgi:hypothetical protein